MASVKIMNAKPVPDADYKRQKKAFEKMNPITFVLQTCGEIGKFFFRN